MLLSNNYSLSEESDMSWETNHFDGNINWKTVRLYAVFLGVILSVVALILLIFFVIYQIRSAGERERNPTRDFYNGIANIGIGITRVTQQPVDSTNNYGTMNDQQKHKKTLEPCPFNILDYSSTPSSSKAPLGYQKGQT